MNKNDANIFLATMLTDEFQECLSGCLVSGNDMIEDAQLHLPEYLTLENSNRLYSDLSAACIRIAILRGNWADLEFEASTESRGAYPGVEVTGETARIVVANSNTFKPNSGSSHIADCIALNSSPGREGQRGVFLLYELDDEKKLKAARLVMRSKRAGELASVAIFPPTRAEARIG